MRLPWQRRGSQLSARVAQALERGGVVVDELAIAAERGRITLRGTVASREVRQRTVELARAVDGVRGVDDPPHAVARPWHAGDDLLVLFTDGVHDARDRFGARFGEQRVLDAVRRTLREPPPVILDAIFRDLAEHTGDAVQRDDLTCVVLRS